MNTADVSRKTAAVPLLGGDWLLLAVVALLPLAIGDFDGAGYGFGRDGESRGRRGRTDDRLARELGQRLKRLTESKIGTS